MTQVSATARKRNQSSCRRLKAELWDLIQRPDLLAVFVDFMLLVQDQVTGERSCLPAGKLLGNQLQQFLRGHAVARNIDLCIEMVGVRLPRLRRRSLDRRRYGRPALSDLRRSCTPYSPALIQEHGQLSRIGYMASKPSVGLLVV